MVDCDVSKRVGILKKAKFQWIIEVNEALEVRWARDVPPPTDPWKWDGAIESLILSPAQVDILDLNP